MKQERKTTYNTFAVLFYINRQKVKKNGLCPLMGRISINTEVAQFSTKMEVQPDLWDHLTDEEIAFIEKMIKPM